MDNASAAAALYGAGPEAGATETPTDTQAAATATDQAAPSTPEQQAEALYAEPEVAEINIPDNIKADRAADMNRRMYDADGQFGHVIKESEVFGEEELAAQYAPEVRRAIVGELREMAADVGMTAEDVRTYQTVARVIKEIPSEETRIGWREQAVQRLNETYGNDAAQVLRDVQKFVRADPRRVRMLEANGLGDHPDAVMLFAKLARQARTAGKLK